MNSFEFLEKLGFSSNEAKVYGTLIKHKVLNGYEIAKLSGVARSLVYEAHQSFDCKRRGHPYRRRT